MCTLHKSNTLEPLTGARVRPLGPCILSQSYSYDRLIGIIFAYFNRENNCYNHFVKP